MLKQFGDFLEKLGQSTPFVAFCGIITILGFVLTIFVLLKAKSINRKIEEYKIIKEYNKRRERLRLSLLDYRNAILLNER